jgi:hypothetical protein
VSGEAIYSTVGTDKYMTCVAEWANSVYHAALLFASTIDIGVAANNFNPAEGASTLCVVDVATSTTQSAQLPGAGNIRAYPYANQVDVPFVFFNRTETPTPVPDLVEAGTPVTVSFETRGMAVTAPISISQFSLTPAGCRRSHPGQQGRQAWSGHRDQWPGVDGRRQYAGLHCHSGAGTAPEAKHGVQRCTDSDGRRQGCQQVLVVHYRCTVTSAAWVSRSVESADPFNSLRARRAQPQVRVRERT